MRRATSSSTAVLLLAAGGTLAQPADGPALLQQCHERQVERWAGVTHYLVDQSMMGNRATLAYERVEVAGADGKAYPAFQPVRGSSRSAGASGYTSEDLRLFAGAAEQVGEGLASEMKNAGFPGALPGGGGDPWASTDPRVMMGGAATFARAAADAQDETERERQATAAQAGESMNHMSEFVRRARVVGSETLDGRVATHLRADGMNQRMSDAGSGELVINAVDFWIDRQHCVPLKVTMNGLIIADGQSRPVTIERVDSDYRPVPGWKMYEPHRQVMRMKGVMTAEQEREMKKAQAQLAESEQRLAQLPPGQREMIMRQMGPQMAMMKSMASGGVFEVETVVHAIHVNPDPPKLRELQSSQGAGPGGGSAGFTANRTAMASPEGPRAPVPAQQQEKSPEQACLEEKIRQRQEAQKKKQGMGRLLGAVGRVAGRLGGAEISRAIGDVHTTQATAEDVAAAARDLGMTEDEIDACRDPG